MQPPPNHDAVDGGHLNGGFADLDEYGFTLKRRDTSGDIIFKPAASRPREEDPFNNLNAFGDIKIDHVVEQYDADGEVREDSETGEKDVVTKTAGAGRQVHTVYEVRNNSNDRNRERAQSRDRAGATGGATAAVDKGAKSEGAGSTSSPGPKTRQTAEVPPVGKKPELNSGSSPEVNPEVPSAGGKPEVKPGTTPEVTSENNANDASRVSMDLDELYKDTHLPEKPVPPKRTKKNKKKQNKTREEGVVDMSSESPFVRSFRPAGSVTVTAPSSEESLGPIDQSQQLAEVHSNGPVHSNVSIPPGIHDNEALSDASEVHSNASQVHSNGSVLTGSGTTETPASTTLDLGIEDAALPYDPRDPRDLSLEFARLDDDLDPIAGFPDTQTFESNVPRLSAHRLAILGGPYRSSKYKRGMWAGAGRAGGTRPIHRFANRINDESKRTIDEPNHRRIEPNHRRIEPNHR